MNQRFTHALLPYLLALPGVLAPQSSVDSTAPEQSTLVIYEVAPSGPFGPDDQYVELRNIGSQPLDIGGWQVKVCEGSHVPVAIMEFPEGTSMSAMGGPGQYLLLTGWGFAGRANSDFDTPDFRYSRGISDTGGWLIADYNGNTVDSVRIGDGRGCNDSWAQTCDWGSEEATIREVHACLSPIASRAVYTCGRARPTNSNG